MTKEVLVSISGMQADIEDTPIELVTTGTYYLKNGKHYVLYEEQPEDGATVTKNVVKFYDGHFEITKKGGVNSLMIFDRGQKTSMIYSTPMGNLQMDVVTKELVIEETAEEMRACIKYALDINYEFVSDCEVNFKIQARG